MEQSTGRKLESGQAAQADAGWGEGVCGGAAGSGRI